MKLLRRELIFKAHKRLKEAPGNCFFQKKKMEKSKYKAHFEKSFLIIKKMPNQAKSTCCFVRISNKSEASFWC